MPIVQVDLSDIISYIGERTRPLKEGEAVLKAGHIICCGLDEYEDKHVKSLCLRTSALVETPHEIKISLAETPWKCQCTCKAGLSGFCKHVIATLIYINRHENLEVLGCTDWTQKWGKEKTSVQEIYSPKPFKEFCHPEIKKKLEFKTTGAIDKANFDLLSLGVGDSAISKFIGRSMEIESLEKENADNSLGFVRDHEEHLLKILLKKIECSEFLKRIKGDVEVPSLDPCCRDILEDLKNASIFEIAFLHPQGSTKWMKERQLRITGSTCYEIYTYGKSNRSVDWESKSLKFFFPKSFTNKYVRHGLKFEKEALEVFRRQSNLEVITPSLIISDLFPWLGFSPDGVIFEGDNPVALLEIKCPYTGKEHDPDDILKTCKFLEGTDPVILKTRHPHYGQVQLGMALLNLPKTHLIVYSPFSKSYLNIVVDFDRGFAEDLIKNISQKYFSYMLHYYCLNKL